MTRREFFKFIVIGGLIGMIRKRAEIRKKHRRAMFWRKV